MRLSQKSNDFDKFKLNIYSIKYLINLN